MSHNQEIVVPISTDWSPYINFMRSLPRICALFSSWPHPHTMSRYNSWSHRPLQTSCYSSQTRIQHPRRHETVGPHRPRAPRRCENPGGSVPPGAADPLPTLHVVRISCHHHRTEMASKPNPTMQSQSLHHLQVASMHPPVCFPCTFSCQKSEMRGLLLPCLFDLPTEQSKLEQRSLRR